MKLPGVSSWVCVRIYMWDKFSVHKRNMSHPACHGMMELAGNIRWQQCLISEQNWTLTGLFINSMCWWWRLQVPGGARCSCMCALWFRFRNGNIYRVLGSDSPHSWKPKMQPAYSPPFSFQPKQPLVSDKSSNTSVSPARGGNQRAIQCLQNLLLSARARSIPDHPGKFTARRLSTNKSARQNERGVVMLAEAVEKAPSWAPNCFSPLYGAAL